MDDAEVLERAQIIAAHYKRFEEIDAMLTQIPALQKERAEIMDQLRAIFLTPTATKEE